MSESTGVGNFQESDPNLTEREKKKDRPSRFRFRTRSRHHHSVVFVPFFPAGVTFPCLHGSQRIKMSPTLSSANEAADQTRLVQNDCVVDSSFGSFFHSTRATNDWGLFGLADADDVMRLNRVKTDASSPSTNRWTTAPLLVSLCWVLVTASSRSATVSSRVPSTIVGRGLLVVPGAGAGVLGEESHSAGCV